MLFQEEREVEIIAKGVQADPRQKGRFIVQPIRGLVKMPEEGYPFHRVRGSVKASMSMDYTRKAALLATENNPPGRRAFQCNRLK
jgi:hypothetical protein